MTFLGSGIAVYLNAYSTFVIIFPITRKYIFVIFNDKLLALNQSDRLFKLVLTTSVHVSTHLEDAKSIALSFLRNLVSLLYKLRITGAQGRTLVGLI